MEPNDLWVNVQIIQRWCCRNIQIILETFVGHLKTKNHVKFTVIKLIYTIEIAQQSYNQTGEKQQTKKKSKLKKLWRRWFKCELCLLS